MIARVMAVVAILAQPACAGGVDTPEDRLSYELDRLESRELQRQTRPSTSSDLMTNQDQRIAEQRLRTLKTRRPRSGDIPLLARQLDRLQRPPALRRR